MKSKSVFSKNALRVAIHENKLMTNNAALSMDITEDQLWEFAPEELDDYGKLRMVVDLVSGMTDKYACSLYDKLSGHSL